MGSRADRRRTPAPNSTREAPQTPPRPPVGPEARTSNPQMPGLAKRRSNRTMGADADRNFAAWARFRAPNSPARRFELAARERKDGPERWAKSPNEEQLRRRAPSPLGPFLGFRVGTDRGCGPAARDFGRRDHPHRGARRGRPAARRTASGHGFARTPRALSDISAYGTGPTALPVPESPGSICLNASYTQSLKVWSLRETVRSNGNRESISLGPS